MNIETQQGLQKPFFKSFLIDVENWAELVSTVFSTAWPLKDNGLEVLSLGLVTFNLL